MDTRDQRMIDFIQTLKIPEGMYQGQQFILRPFQQEIIRSVYGDLDDNGLRITRKGIFSVAKKNGKTPLIAGLALGHLVGPEAKRNEQLYSAAYERDQAAITFRYMRQMIEMDSELSDILNVKTATKEIDSLRNGSTFKALSSESKSKHGLGPALIIFDELAQFGADRDFYDTLIQGRGAHLEPLLWIISTQADDDLAVLSQEIDYALKFGKKDKTVKLFFFTSDPEADITDRKTWESANPALDDFLSVADMKEAASTAQNMPSAEHGFRNLRLNQRTSSTARFMSGALWKKNGRKPEEKALINGRITAGLDLSSKNDLSALILDAFYENEHHLFSRFWTPLDNLKERIKSDRVPYKLWIDQGFLIGVPGKTINYEFIAKEVANLHREYKIRELRFDRWRIDDFQNALEKTDCLSYVKGKDDVPLDSNPLCLVQHGQGYKDMNPAIEGVEDVFTDERVRHGNHPVLTMCASNAVIIYDPAKNRKFDKHKATGRIDGIVAAAMAINGAELLEEESKIELPVFF